MDTFFLITLLVSAATVDCANLTIYLGPRWGTKVIRYEPQYTSTETGRPVPQHRPVPEDSAIRVIDMDEDADVDSSEIWFKTRTTGRLLLPPTSPPPVQEGPAASGDLNGRSEDALSLTGLGLTGDVVKRELNQLSDDLKPQLRRLYLGYNNIEQLPVLTFPVDLEYGLEELSLNDNPLTRLDSYTRFELSRLGNLKTLNLSRADLLYLETLYIPSLEVLDLSDNQLSFLPSSLKNLPKLRKLYLDGNHITGIYYFPMDALLNLQVLSLSSNQLYSISENSLISLINLQSLYLNNNSLTSLSHLNVHRGVRVYLSGNPFQCSCPLVALFTDYRFDVVDKEKITCVDGEHDFPRRADSLTERDVHIQCHTALAWLHKRGENVENVLRWFRHHGLNLSTLLWVLLIVAVVLIVWRHRRARKVAPLELPYNILDDKNQLP